MHSLTSRGVSLELLVPTTKRTADSALLSDDAWQEASMAAKIIGTYPDCRRWSRNKVHFHGITISGNWHLQQHRDVLSSPPAALSYFRTGRETERDAGRRTRSRGYVRIANVCFIRHPFAGARARRSDSGDRNG